MQDERAIALFAFPQSASDCFRANSAGSARTKIVKHGFDNMNSGASRFLEQCDNHARPGGPSGLYQRKPTRRKSP
jgi:hypothetical protein